MSTVASAATAAVQAASGRIFNFSAGPGVLPEEVLRQVQEDVWNIAGTGIGILEHSHRGKVADRIFAECEADCRRVGNVPANYRILFMTGGASAQNHLIPMNFLPAGKTADYLITGYWAQKSYDQAAKMASWPGGLYGRANIAANTKDQNHSYIPDDAQIRWTSGAAYAHYTSNNTIYGTQWHRVPTPPPGVPLMCDASSDIFCRPIDIARFGLIYAGAQKNLGPAGVTLVIIRDDLIEAGNRHLPDLLQYRTYVADYSRVNTPPVFAVYVMGLVFKWMLAQGGLGAIQKRNEAKARLIYDVLDASSFYRPHARRDSRSLMTITFRLPTPELEDRFVREAEAAGLDGLKGHRSVGGIRVSIYNAFPLRGCEALAQFMREFERRHG